MRGLRSSLVSLVSGAIMLAACAVSTDETTNPLEGDAAADGASTIVDVDSATSPEAGTESGTEEAGSTCGNGELDTGEACDDGNRQSNDGCSAACTVESALEGDICPGATIALTGQGARLHGTVNGSTAPAFNHYGSACGGGSGRDMVYAFTPPSSGKAIVTLTADFPAIVSSRTTCEDAASEGSCADITVPTGGATTLEVSSFANQPVYLIVDGYGGSSGTFTLDVDVSTAVCGNGIAEAPEDCDDGNLVAGDGCSSTCNFETNGVSNNCPGQPFVLTGAPGAVRKISFAGDTLLGGGVTLNPAGCFYGSGKNVVYAIKSDVTGSVSADAITGYGRANLSARTDCFGNDYQLACTQIETPGAIHVDFPVTANQWFFVSVDGDTSYGGPYTLNVAVTPATCGNHVLDGAEQCDDGNGVAGDGCAADCTLEPFTDADACPGHPVALTKQDDDAYTGVVSGTTKGMASNFKGCASYAASADTVYSVRPSVDGYLEATVKGQFNAVVGLLKSCTGNQTTDAASAMDCSFKLDLNTVPYTLTGLGTVAKSVGAPVAANTTYYLFIDSSNATGFPASGPYELNVKVTPATCGNGRIEGTETCDDGNQLTNDGCDAECHVEPITSRSTCANAEAITLAPLGGGSYGASLARGTTNLLANANFTSSPVDPCQAPGKNAFFSVTAPAAGVLHATARSSAFDVVLGIRRPGCALTGTPAMCASASAKGSAETLDLAVATGETVYVVVDGKDATEAGPFLLDVSFAPPSCGDAFFTPTVNEECDDGNSIDGDGCSATCKLEAGITGVDVCPGYTLALTGTGDAPRKGTVTFGTANLTSDYVGACGGNAQDGVVRVVPKISGTLTAKAHSMANVTVYARSVCNDTTTEFPKTNQALCAGVVQDTVVFGVEADQEYFIFVDGLDGATGVPTLDVTVTR